MKKIWSFKQPDWVKERRDEVFRTHPQVRRFVESKERFFKILMVLITILSVVKIISQVIFYGAYGFAYLLPNVLGWFLYLYALDECMASSLDSVRRGCFWIFGLFLLNVIMGGYSIWQIYAASGGNLLAYFVGVVALYPWMAVLLFSDVLAIVFFLADFVLFAWMFLVPENKKMGKVYDEMMTLRQPAKKGAKEYGE